MPSLATEEWNESFRFQSMKTCINRLQLCPSMNSSICLLWLFSNPFRIERQHKLQRCTIWRKGGEGFNGKNYKQTSALCLQIAMILTFRWVWTFQWKGVRMCILLCLGAVFIFFDNKLGNYSVMIKIYSKTRRMKILYACVRVVRLKWWPAKLYTWKKKYK